MKISRKHKKTNKKPNKNKTLRKKGGARKKQNRKKTANNSKKSNFRVPLTTPPQKTLQQYNSTSLPPLVCDKSMTFEECELAILKDIVKKAEETQGREVVQDPTVKDIISIVEDFIRKEKLICYGGTAINNLLPKEDQFYNLDVELPDYDVYSNKAITHATRLADTFYKNGYKEVEARAGVHVGTYKVYVNFIAVADITQLPDELFDSIKAENVILDGIRYAPVNYLRMSMYKELSRPKGDISRWEKVMKRLVLLNKNYPLRGENCEPEKIQRVMESIPQNDFKTDKIFYIIRDLSIDNGAVFFGSFANSLYMRYLPKGKRRRIQRIPDFDILVENPDTITKIIAKELEREKIGVVQTIKHDSIGEVIPEHIELRIDTDTVAFFYKAEDCYSYNTVRIREKEVKIASIDTMLNFYLAFLYNNRPYYDKNRIFCMAEYLFRIQQKNRLSQFGLLRRFSTRCFGEPITIQNIRAKRNEKFKELKTRRKSKEYKKYFFRYIPGDT